MFHSRWLPSARPAPSPRPRARAPARCDACSGGRWDRSAGGTDGRTRVRRQHRCAAPAAPSRARRSARTGRPRACPTAAATCMAPESLDTATRHLASTPASVTTSVRPMRFTNPPRLPGPAANLATADSIAAPVSRSAGAPSSTQTRPGRLDNSAMTSTTCSGGHRFAAPNAAPGANPTSVASSGNAGPFECPLRCATCRRVDHQPGGGLRRLPANVDAQRVDQAAGSRPSGGARSGGPRRLTARVSSHRRASARVAPALGEPARAAIHAEPNELVSSTTRSKRPAFSVATSALKARPHARPLEASATTSSTPSIIAARGARAAGTAAAMRPASAQARITRHAGSAITMSPSQLGKRTRVRGGHGLRPQPTAYSLQVLPQTALESLDDSRGSTAAARCAAPTPPRRTLGRTMLRPRRYGFPISSSSVTAGPSPARGNIPGPGASSSRHRWCIQSQRCG